MVQEADVIVHGNVISAKVEPHPQFKNLSTVLITMDVMDTLKGKTGKTFQFRQYIWDIRDELDAARYAKGQELLLFLGPVSKYGLTSPIGLEQGRFAVQRDSSTGQPVAVNGKGNAGLFHAMADRSRAQGRVLAPATKKLIQDESSRPIPLTELKTAIRNFREPK